MASCHRVDIAAAFATLAVSVAVGAQVVAQDIVIGPTPRSRNLTHWTDPVVVAFIVVAVTASCWWIVRVWRREVRETREEAMRANAAPAPPRFPKLQGLAAQAELDALNAEVDEARARLARTVRGPDGE